MIGSTMTRKKSELLSDAPNGEHKTPIRLTYWRSSRTCFSIDYKGIITEICEGDLGYGDMNRMDGAIHAAIGCKRKADPDPKCKLKKV
jgi:hypothetical protein